MNSMKQTLPRAVAIVGPTATGKTDAGIAICQALKGEVLSIDSMQVYIGMDIGTAKPTLEERQGIPHHMLDVVSPAESYSAARFRQGADAALDDMLARGKLPVLVGGTGLYLNALTYTMEFAGAAGDGAYRGELEAQAETEAGRQQLHDMLRMVDPASAERLHVNDTRRVIRALEIFHQSGRPMSEHETDFKQQKRKIDPVVIGLRMPRDMLYQRINDRVDRMLAQGLLDEVRKLYNSDIPQGTQAMQAIGYKEYFAFLAGECSMEDATALVKQRSRQYAKRQLTWFGRDDRVYWFDITMYPEKQALHAAILQHILEQGLAQ